MNSKSRSPWAVFLDRDGVINDEIGLIAKPEALRLLPGVAGAIKRLNESEILSIVITNQPVVARGIVSESGLAAIHKRLDDLLAREGAYLDALYYCPHYPTSVENPNADPKYLIDCSCRKPKTGLFERAKSNFHLAPSRCFLIGDSTRDIKAGKDFGCRTILVKTGHAGQDGKYSAAPDFVCRDLAEAVKLILRTIKN